MVTWYEKIDELPLLLAIKGIGVSYHGYLHDMPHLQNDALYVLSPTKPN